jgi:hypothetical protein
VKERRDSVCALAFSSCMKKNLFSCWLVGWIGTKRLEYNRIELKSCPFHKCFLEHSHEMLDLL